MRYEGGRRKKHNLTECATDISRWMGGRKEEGRLEDWKRGWVEGWKSGRGGWVEEGDGWKRGMGGRVEEGKRVRG